MKAINTYINERLVLSKNKQRTMHTLFPESTEELERMIYKEIKKNGNECSLNHIDVSKIRYMDMLFGSSFTQFNGDISEWDVSNVESMFCMFDGSKFNGDISEWDVSKVERMNNMFAHSDFNGDISSWDVSNVINMSNMFEFSPFNGDISNWDVSNVENMNGMFFNCPLQNNPPKWYNNEL